MEHHLILPLTPYKVERLERAKLVTHSRLCYPKYDSQITGAEWFGLEGQQESKPRRVTEGSEEGSHLHQVWHCIQRRHRALHSGRVQAPHAADRVGKHKTVTSTSFDQLLK
jgi:hypothetical protein